MDGQDLITCLVPGCGKQVKGMAGHIKAHHMSLNAYKAAFRDPITGEDPPVGWTAKDRLIDKLVNLDADNTPPSSAPTPATNLTADESAYFTKRESILTLQAEEDPALVSLIREVVLNEIHIARYQGAISKTNKKLISGKLTSEETLQLKSLSQFVKDLQNTNLNLLDSMNLTRHKKQQTKKSIVSTPSRLVAALEIMARNWTPDQLRRSEQEMEEAAAMARRNLSELKGLVPEAPRAEDGIDAAV